MNRVCEERPASLTTRTRGWYNKGVASSLSFCRYDPSPGGVHEWQDVLGIRPLWSFMQEILKQLGDLVLGSLPTVIFFLILLGAYGALVRRPLDRVLAERFGRTGGAMNEAKAAISAAEQKTTEYETKLRKARAEMFEARTARQKAATEARDRALAEAREAAQHRIAVARASVETSGAEAKAQIEAGAATLSQQVLAAILPHRAGSAGGSQVSA